MTLKDLLRFDGTLAGLDKDKVYFIKIGMSVSDKMMKDLSVAFKKFGLRAVWVRLENLDDFQIVEPTKRRRNEI